MSNDLNLNQQLCELCGIEGKEGQPECLSIDTPVCKRGFTACCAENCTGCKYFNRFEKVYPDFTKPENFVRLYEIASSTTKEGYLNYVCMRLTYEKNWVKDALAKAIREQKWVYD